MRYTIVINQLALIEMECGITLEEAVLLDYLFWLTTSPSEEVEQMRIERDGKKYTWFDYGFYIKETPILGGKSKSRITPKIKKLEEEELIETVHGDNFRVYVRLLPRADSAFRKQNANRNVSFSKTKRLAFRKRKIDNNSNIDNINKIIEKENPYPNVEDVKEKDLEEIAEKYHVPLTFVQSKYDDMVIWVKEKPNDKRLKGRNWRMSLMNWVKRDAIKIMERRNNDPRSGIDARNV
jgi:DNA-binding MarR family transcriptional regulator